MQFQRGKLQKRQVEAFLANSLLPEEIDEQIQREAAISTTKALKSRKARMLKEARHAATAVGHLPEAALFTGLNIHIADADRCPELDQIAHVADWQWAEVLGDRPTPAHSCPRNPRFFDPRSSKARQGHFPCFYTLVLSISLP